MGLNTPIQARKLKVHRLDRQPDDNWFQTSCGRSPDAGRCTQVDRIPVAFFVHGAILSIRRFRENQSQLPIRLMTTIIFFECKRRIDYLNLPTLCHDRQRPVLWIGMWFWLRYLFFARMQRITCLARFLQYATASLLTNSSYV